MIRTVRAATNSANRTSTAATIKPIIPASSVADERRGAPDLHYVHARARLDHAVVVVGARGPDLALQAHAAQAGVVVDALEHDRGLTDEGGRPGADLRGYVQMALGDRPHDGEARRGQDGEHRPRQRRTAAREIDHRRPRRTDREREQEEAEV